MNLKTYMIVVQSNLYAQQNDREYQTNAKERMAFLGTNYIMSINQLPTVQSYWECGQFIGNKGIRNIMTRQRFKDILRKRARSLVVSDLRSETKGSRFESGC